MDSHRGSHCDCPSTNEGQERPELRGLGLQPLPSLGMARMPRNHLADGIYHITARGTGGIAIFDHDLDRLDFLSFVGRARRRFSWICSA